MQKTLFIFALLLVLQACNSKEKTAVAPVTVSEDFDLSQLPKKTNINSNAMLLLKDWEAYTSFEKSIDAVYAAENREDLLLTMDDIIEKQKELEAAVYPKEFDIPQIKSRQRVVKTYVLKIKAGLEDRVDVTPAMIEMLQSFNAFRKQFNVTVNSSIDTKLLLDETGN